MKEYNKRDWLILALIITVGIFLRWYGLDERPIHHDESLHAIYSKYYYINPTIQYYKYDPMLHGPFLYHLVPAFYHFFGITKYVARMPMAIIGSLFLFIPLLFRRFIGKRMLLVSTLVISLSPSLIYWSRFLRHDMIVLFCLLSSLIIYFSKIKYKYSLIIPLMIVWMCTKENYYLFYPVLLGFFIYQRIINKEKINFILQRKRICDISIGLIAGAFIYCYYYSAGFQYMQGIKDGLYNKGLLYWFNQHSIERISGPFSYHIFNLAWYEFTFFALLIIHFIQFYVRAPRRYLVSPLAALSISVISLGIPSINIFVTSFFKLKIPIDYFTSFFLITHSLALTTYYLKMNKKALAFFGYMFFANLFSYSYVGEKVPWLSLYPFVFGLLFFSLYYKEQLQKLNTKVFTTLTILTAVFMGRMTYISNFKNAGEASEFISQVHTAKEYEQFTYKVLKEIHSPEILKKPRVVNIRDNTWPLSWYMHGTGQYNFQLKPGDQRVRQYDFVFTSTNDALSKKQLKKSHKRIITPMRVWWVPDYSKMGFSEFFSYAFTHRPWNPTGSQRVAIFIKKLE